MNIEVRKFEAIGTRAAIMRNRKILVGLVSILGLCCAHLAHAEQLVMPTLAAHGSTLAMLLCGFTGLLKARRNAA